MIRREDAKKQIVLTLTNNSSTNNSTVSLFSFGSNSTSGVISSTSVLQSVGIDSSEFTGTSNWLIRYYLPPNTTTLNNFIITDPTDIDDLISKLNAEFGDIFWYESDPVFTYSLRVADSSRFDFFSIVPSPSPARLFTDGTQSFISGTTVQVSVGYNVSYRAICTDFTTQPYFITSMYVASSSQSQTTQQLIASIVDATGAARTKPIQPVTDPNQSQNVQMAIPVYMPTSAMNELQYTMLAGATATVIVRYEHIDLFDGLKLIDSGQFQNEMSLLRAQDQKEFERIMEVVKGFKVVAEEQNPNMWSEPRVKNPENQPVITFAVPLIYVIAKENGNFFVEML